MCRWIVEDLGPDVPLHFSAFHPDFRLTRPRADAAGDAGPGPRHRPPGRAEVCLYGQYQRPAAAEHLLPGLRPGVDRAGRLPSGGLRAGGGPLPALRHGDRRPFRRGPRRLGSPPDAGPHRRLRPGGTPGRPPARLSLPGTARPIAGPGHAQPTLRQGDRTVNDQPRPAAVNGGKPKLSKPQEQMVFQAACRRVIAAVVGSPPERLEEVLGRNRRPAHAGAG